jgi:hypothetical protein
MAFTRVRTIRKKNGKSYQYRYLEYRWREGKKVRSKSVLIGAVKAVTAFIEANRTRRYGMPDDEVVMKQFSERAAREAQAKQIFANEMHGLYGMKLDPTMSPSPIDKPAPQIDLVPAAEPPQSPMAEESLTDVGEAEGDEPSV